MSKELYVVLSPYDHVIDNNDIELPMPQGIKILYAFDSKEEARELARQSKVKILTLRTDEFSSEKNN
jgi:hypothetical protein